MIADVNQTNASPVSVAEPDAAAPPVLAVKGVTKRFGGAAALSNVDGNVPPGDSQSGRRAAGRSPCAASPADGLVLCVVKE